MTDEQHEDPALAPAPPSAHPDVPAQGPPGAEPRTPEPAPGPPPQDDDDVPPQAS